MADWPGPEEQRTPYTPPLTLTPALLNSVASIAEALGRWSVRQEALPSPPTTLSPAGIQPTAPICWRPMGC